MYKKPKPFVLKRKKKKQDNARKKQEAEAQKLAQERKAKEKEERVKEKAAQKAASKLDAKENMELKRHDDNLHKVCSAELSRISVQVFQWFAPIHPCFWLLLVQLICCLVAQPVLAIIGFISTLFGYVYTIACPVPPLDGSVSSPIPPSQHWLCIGHCWPRISNNSSVSATTCTVLATIAPCQQRCPGIINCLARTSTNGPVSTLAPYQSLLAWYQEFLALYHQLLASYHCWLCISSCWPCISC